MYYFSWKLFYQGNKFFTFSINIRYQHRLRGSSRAFLVRETGKTGQQSSPFENSTARNAQALFYGMYCEVMRKSISGGNSRRFSWVSPDSGVLPIRKRWTGTQFIAWPWSVAGAAGNRFSARSGIGSGRRPAITLAVSRWTTHHMIHRRFRDLTRATTVINAKATIRL